MEKTREDVLRVAVIGCGGIFLGKHGPGLAKDPRVQIVGLCDTDPARIDKALASSAMIKRAEDDPFTLGSYLAGVGVCSDYKKMLGILQPDVVHVCTPNISHSEITIAALLAGAHVMCEKPMSKTAAGARAMLAAAYGTGRKLSIGYQNRHRADSQYVAKMRDTGEIGDVYYAQAHAIRRCAVPTWGVFLDNEAQGGGPIIDIGTHALDLAWWLMGNFDWESVTGMTFRQLADQPNPANPWGAWKAEDYQFETLGVAMIRMKNGAIVNLEASWILNTTESIEAVCQLHGTKAGIDMRNGLRIANNAHGAMQTVTPALDATGVAFYSPDHVMSPGDLEVQRWIDAIVNDTDPYVLPEEALAVSEALEAVYVSSKHGGAPVNRSHFDQRVLELTT